MPEETPDNAEQPRPADEEKPEPAQLPELTEVDMLSSRIVELENSANQMKDQLLRKAAEFENYKKRVESDYTAIVRLSNEELISKLLPVLDDFERSLKALKAAGEKGPAEKGKSPEGSENALLRGMELIYTKLFKLLELQGVKHFEVLGRPFDPQLHDALMQVYKPGTPPHMVIEEVEKGYTLNDKVIRHARVIVSADMPPAATPVDGKEEPEGRESPEGKQN